MDNDKCTILVNSCDAFSDVWELFFSALKEQWPECKYPIVLNTESLNYIRDDMNIRVCNDTTQQKKDCWGKRYKNVLKLVKTPFVIPLLEDFVLDKPFSGEQLIENTIEWMEKNPKIGAFYLHKHPNVIQEKTRYPGFGKMPQRCEYKLSTQVGIWRKEFLDKCIKGIESPWEWEIYTTKKAFRFKEEIYALLESEEEIFSYPRGGVIWRGLWNTKVIELAQKYNVGIDFSKRGIMDENNPYRLEQHEYYSIRKHLGKDVATKEFWKMFGKKVKIIAHNKYRSFLCQI